MSKYGSQGFNIIAFPCNQFMGQEPGSNPEIKSFAAGKQFTGVLMDKVDVNGGNSSPVFKWLKMASGDESAIAWNFGKFLVGKDGQVVARYGPQTSPLAVAGDIEKALEA